MAHLCRYDDYFNSYELGVLDNDKNIIGVANGTARTTRDGIFDLRISGSSVYLGKFHFHVSKLGSKTDDWVVQFLAFANDATRDIGTITANISSVNEHNDIQIQLLASSPYLGVATLSFRYSNILPHGHMTLVAGIQTAPSADVSFISIDSNVYWTIPADTPESTVRSSTSIRLLPYQLTNHKTRSTTAASATSTTAKPTAKPTVPTSWLFEIKPKLQVLVRGVELINLASVLQVSKPVSGSPENYDVIIRVNNSHEELISLSTTAAFQGSSSDSWMVKPSVAILRYTNNVLDSFNYAATFDTKRESANVC